MRRPKAVTKDELLHVLDDLTRRIRANDSFEGSLEYFTPHPDDGGELPENTDFMLRAAYRVGNSDGSQGGMRIVGEL